MCDQEVKACAVFEAIKLPSDDLTYVDIAMENGHRNSMEQIGIVDFSINNGECSWLSKRLPEGKAISCGTSWVPICPEAV